LGWKQGFTSKYARGHNARVDSIFFSDTLQKEMARKRREACSSPWNAGLTKETSEKVLEMSRKISSSLLEGHSTGKIQDWRERDPTRAVHAAEKISATKKKKFALGALVPWNKGLSKETSPSIVHAARRISERYGSPGAGRRLKPTELRERIDRFSDKFQLVSSLEDYKTRRVDRLEFLCKSCGAQQMKSLAMLEESPVCFVCSPKESRGQLELFELVKALAPDAVLSDRSAISPKELDVWIPSRRLGIEYNGLYWHSAANLSDPEYHVKKMHACYGANISLFSIYEDEWRSKRHIVEGMIRHRLGLPAKKLDARKLEVVELGPSVARTFFDENHLEGHVVGMKYFALLDPASSEIMAAVSLRKPFHKKYEGALELGRCCTRVNYSIRGWLGKLTRAARDYAKSVGANKLITYVDLRVGIGSGYQAAGWTLVSAGSEPRFWWTDYTTRYNRFKFRADSKNGLSQAQVAAAAGVSQIFGLPNSLYALILD
jgi:hypothetical protein